MSAMVRGHSEKPRFFEEFEVTAKPEKCIAFLTENGNERSESRGKKFASRKAYSDVRAREQICLTTQVTLSLATRSIKNKKTYE